MKKITLFGFLFAILAFHSGFAPKKAKEFWVMTYNVENLFDTIDDPLRQDEDFQPWSAKKWTGERYQTKLNNLARVIGSVRPAGFPDLVGLCEVENRRVLEDLVLRDSIRKAGYRIAHEESPDPRGIDVALLYNPLTFKFIRHKIFPITSDGEPNLRTRDILYVVGTTGAADTLHVFVNHWSSRRGGQEATERKRINQAKVLRSKVDSICSVSASAKIIIIGDFNDSPVDKSLGILTDTLQSKHCRLVNLTKPGEGEQPGTHNYQGEWNIIDQVIVSRVLECSKKGLSAHGEKAMIYSESWMLYHDKKKDLHLPRQTYEGNKYYGGFSDHLPVYLKMKIK